MCADQQFDEAMVDELVDSFCEGVLAEQVRTSPDSRTIGAMPPQVTPLMVSAGLKAVLVALSQTHAIVPKDDLQYAYNLLRSIYNKGTDDVLGGSITDRHLREWTEDAHLTIRRLGALLRKEAPPDVR